MNCHRIKRSGKPAGWLHSLFCAECRASQRTDDVLAFGVVQLRKQTSGFPALNRTLAALDLPPVGENYLLIQRKRHRKHLRRGAAATVLLGAFGWCGYMNWLPAEPLSDLTRPDTRGYDALLAANSALKGDPTKIAKDVGTLETSTGVGPLSEADNVQRFVGANASALAMLRANLNTPYQESIPRSLSEAIGRPYALYPLSVALQADAALKATRLSVALQADAALKASRGDHTGALTAATHLISFGENVEGGGSLMTRLAGIRSQTYGRRSLWPLLPAMSAEDARLTARKLEESGARHVPLQTTIRWEREAGVAIRYDLLSRPLWRWHCADLFAPDYANRPFAPQSISMAISLHGFSNRHIFQDYLVYMDAVEKQLNAPFRAADPAPLPIPTDWINGLLLPSYSNLRFAELNNEAQNALLRTALALHAYYLDRGAYPPNLQALCPTYLEHVPADPFQPGSAIHYSTQGLQTEEFDFNPQGSVQTVHYTLKGRQTPLFDTVAHIHGTSAYPKYLLYSVGPDGIDQHGNPILHGDTTSLAVKLGNLSVSPDSSGDIVADINR